MPLDAEATRDDILGAIETWLVKGTRPDGDALLHFRGHGFR